MRMGKDVMTDALLTAGDMSLFEASEGTKATPVFDVQDLDGRPSRDNIFWGNGQ